MNDDRLDPAVETLLYRIVQESLTNLGRQSGTNRIEIDLNRVNSLVTLHIGCDAEDPHTSTTISSMDGQSEIELLGIRERVVAIGGDLSWTDFDTGRFTIDIQVPDHPKPD